MVEKIKLGSVVRCTDDGALGRIVWANGVSVKIKWDDGESVTWRRDSLADRPIEILTDDDGTEPVTLAAAEPAPPETPTTAAAPSAAEGDAIPAPATPDATDASVGDAVANPAEPPAPAEPATDAETEPASATPNTYTIHQLIGQALDRMRDWPQFQQLAAEIGLHEPIPDERWAVARRAVNSKLAAARTPREPREGGKMSALDAAAKVLEETGQALNAKELIQLMSAKGYWTSPGGATPESTLSAAIGTEIRKKGDAAHFVKTGPGKWTRRS